MLRLLATETVFVYGWRDVALAVVIAGLFLFVVGVYVWAWVSVQFDRLRAWFKKERA